MCGFKGTFLFLVYRSLGQVVSSLSLPGLRRRGDGRARLDLARRSSHEFDEVTRAVRAEISVNVEAYSCDTSIAKAEDVGSGRFVRLPRG